MDEFCIICGSLYDATTDPYHEEECGDQMAEATEIRIKTIPELTSILKDRLEKTK